MSNLIGYGVENGDLAKGIGGGFPTLPVYAYIPMKYNPFGFLVPIEFEHPIAYLDQMRAKRVCERERKRMKPRKISTHIMGVTIK